MARAGLAGVVAVILTIAGGACRISQRQGATRPSASPATAYPAAVDVSRVGTYPALTKSGAGYFYDEVLEYRVWLDRPEDGGDTYQAFATYEEALRYSKATARAEEPLVLVLQRESINEPSPGVFVHERAERITEWRVEWLAGNQRQPGSIEKFLEERRGGPTKR